MRLTEILRPLHVGDIVTYAYAPGAQSAATGDSGILTAINGNSVRVTAAAQLPFGVTCHPSSDAKHRPRTGEMFAEIAAAL
jgi:hypothetical protein